MGKQKSPSTTTKVKLNKYQKQVLPLMANIYKGEYAPMAEDLANISMSQRDGLASQTIDYNSLLGQGVGQALMGQNGIAQLSTGQLPQPFMDNIQASLKDTSQNLFGNTVTDMANRGIINSSVTNKALYDNSATLNNAIVNKQSDYMNQLNGMYNDQISNAGALIGLAGSAQGNAQNAATNSLTDSLNAYNAASSILSSGSGQQTTQNAGGNNLLNGLLGIGSAFLMCFTADTKITTTEGEKDIKDVVVGDKVLCLDDNLNEIYQDVIEIQEPVEKEVYEVVAENGSVKTTLTQPLMTKSSIFIEVGLMKLNTDLMFAGKVKEFINRGKMPVYDLKVSGKNNYLANGFVAFGMYEKE